MNKLKPWAIMLVVAVVMLCASTSQAASPQETLSRLKAKSLQVQSIQCLFTQEKRLNIFKQTIISKGNFAFKRPDSLRWEYLEPVRSGFVLKGDVGLRWNDLSGESRDFSVRKDPIMQLVSGQILLWTTLDLDTLSKTYRIEVESDAPAVLRFTPLAAATGPILGMRITFAADDLSIKTIEFMEAEGDSTLIRFHDVRLNSDIEDEVFTRK